LWCWIKSSFVDLDGWQNGWFWFVWGGFLRGDYLKPEMPLISAEKPLPPRGNMHDYFAPDRRSSKIKQQTNCCTMS
jgi:hypothetical protein